MRIGIDIRILSAGFSGIPNYVKNILDNLQKIDQKNSYFLFEYPGCNYIPHNKKWKKVMPYSHIPSIIVTQLLIPFYIKKFKLDFYIASDYIAPLLAPKKTKIITIIYDLTYVHFPKTMAWKRLLISRFFTYTSMLRSRDVFTISDFIKNDIIKTFPKISPKIRVIKCGTPKNWIIPANYNPEQRGNYLLFVGNLEPRKNLLNLIKALEVIKEKRRKDISLHIVGQHGWKHREINDHINESIVKGNIVFKGFLSNEKLQKEYLNCKAFVFPSFYEGFGIPVIEALWLDCIVLTSIGTVMQENAGDAALYFDPYSPVSIAESIGNVYSSNFDRNEVLKNKYDILGKYSWESSAKEILRIINIEN